MGSITMVKKVKARKPKAPETKAIVLSEVALAENQRKVITAETPKEFIKERPGRGGKSVRYVEGGYVVAKLNQAFGPLNWEFEVLAEDVNDNEVTVRGKLTIKDHVKGFSVSKTQYGGHGREKNVPLGDTKKAAATDALKKCASLLGIALDVYWKQLDEEPKKVDNKGVKGEMSASEMFARAKQMIAECDDLATLGEWWKRIEASKHYTKEQKAELIKSINAKIDKSTNKNA